jgi:hypothetical protein
VYLLPLVVSLTHGHSARHLIQRVLLENADVDALADWSCMIKGATSQTSCEEEEESDRHCVWCPFGSDVGACVSVGQGDAINQLKFPNLVCGSEDGLDDEAATFWDQQMGCSVAGNTQAECLSSTPTSEFSCTWCVVHDPPFAMCMGQEFMETIEDLQPGEEPVRIAEVIHCSTDVSKNDDHEDIYGLMDLSCVMAGRLGGGDEGACMEAADATGRHCVSVMTALTGAACVTETQNELLSWTIDLMEDMGVKSQNVESPEDALASDMDEGDKEDGGRRA